jgi:hypothetical protein
MTQIARLGIENNSKGSSLNHIITHKSVTLENALLAFVRGPRWYSPLELGKCDVNFSVDPGHYKFAKSAHKAALNSGSKLL